MGKKSVSFSDSHLSLPVVTKLISSPAAEIAHHMPFSPLQRTNGERALFWSIGVSLKLHRYLSFISNGCRTWDEFILFLNQV